MKRAAIILIALLQFVLLACGISVAGSDDQVAQSEQYFPAISVSPQGSAAGNTHQLEFSGFPPSQSLAVYFNNDETGETWDLFYVEVDQSGYAFVPYTTDTNAAPGSYRFVAYGSGFDSASGLLVIDLAGNGTDQELQRQEQAQSPDQTSGSPKVETVPTGGSAGDRFDLWATNFSPGSTVVFNVYDSENRLLSSFEERVRANGLVTGTVYTNSAGPAGQYFVEVVGEDSDYANTYITITKPVQLDNNQQANNQPSSEVSDAQFNAMMSALSLNLNVFWSINFNKLWPEYAGQYLEPEFLAYIPPFSECGRGPDFTTNNAFYCNSNVNTVYFDWDWFKQEYAEYGIFFPAYILSHEWGHKAQQVTGQFYNVLSVNREMQADCFAGAYIAWGQDKGYYDDRDVAQVVPIAAKFAAGDGQKWAWTQPDLHGGALRIGAFEYGYTKGIDSCKDLIVYLPPGIQE